MFVVYLSKMIFSVTTINARKILYLTHVVGTISGIRINTVFPYYFPKGSRLKNESTLK